jgi:TetR/AcrR family transcriptional regulator, transcriptional repressor for nem operon
MGRTSDAKARLLASAMALMYARGYTAVGVQEICAHASVHKGSFYYFFPSKRALALAVIDAYGQHICRLWQDALATDGPVLARLQRVVAQVCETHHALVEAQGQMHGCPLGNLILELSGQDEELRQRLHDTVTRWADAIAGILHQAVAAGELPALDPALTAQMIVAYFEGVVMFAKLHNDPDMVHRLAQGALHLVDVALQTPHPVQR